MRDLSVPVLICVMFCAVFLVAATEPGVAAEPEIEIRGRIIDGDGEGLAKVVVEMWPWLGRFEDDLRRLESGASDDPLASVRSDGQGYFELKTPLGSNLYLRARAPGRLPMAVRLPHATGDVELRTLKMTPASKVKVRVVSGGRPIAGAWVRLASYWAEGLWLPAGQRGRSGEDGIVELRHAANTQIVRGRYGNVSVFAPGLAPTVGHLPDSGTVTIDLVASAPREIEVRNAAGHPVAGALVRVQGARPVGVTDDTGRLIVHPPVGSSFHVSAETVAGEWAAEEVAPPEADDTEPAILMLKAPATIAGRVLDARSGRPVAGARVWLEMNPGRFADSAGDGSYRLDFPVNRRDFARALATAPGYLRPNRQGSHRSAGVTQDLKLELLVPLRGRVVDARGDAIAGAEVIARSQQAAELLTRSSDDGSFRLSAAGNMLYGLEVKKSGYVTARSEAAAGADPLEIVLPFGLPGEGVVVDVGGSPVPGAEVSLSEPRPFSYGPFPRERSEPLYRAVAGSEGWFEIHDLAPGKLDLEVKASGFAPTVMQGVEITSNGGAVDFGTLVLEPGVGLEGRVVDADGRPLTRATVRWLPWEEGYARGFSARPDLPAVTSDADGRFVIEDLVHGDKLTLEAGLKGYSEAQAIGVKAPADEPLILVLEKQGVVRGIVVDGSGEPVPEAMVSIMFQSEGGGGHGTGMQCEADGSFEVEVDAGGRIQLSAISGDLSSSDQWLEVTPGQIIDDVRLVLEPGGVVEGVVLGPTGEAIAGAVVGVSGGRSFRNGQEVTDEDGTFRLGGLRFGQLVLYVSAEGFPRARRNLEVGPGDNSVEIRMRATHEVHGWVVDDTLRPVGGVLVSLSGSDYGGAVSDVDGKFVVDVPDGRYRVSAVKEGVFARAQLDEEVEVAGEPVTGLEIRLTEGAAIVGRVLGLEADRLSKVQVVARGGGSSPLDHEGSYRIEHLAPQEWVVVATERASGRTARGQVVLESGVSEAILDLEFTSGLTLAGRVTIDGEPSPGAQIRAYELLPGTDQRLGSRHGWTDYRGSFVLSDLQPGDYRLEVRQGALLRQLRFELTSDRELEIELQALELSGRVVDAETGEPLQDAWVVLEPTGIEGMAGVPRQQADAAGLFHFPRVAEGRYRLRVTLDGYAPLVQALEVFEGGDLQGLVLQLDRAEGLTLQVRLATGGVPPRIWIAAMGASGEVLFNRSFEVSEDGDVRLSSLPAGSWILLLAAPRLGTLQLGVTAPGDPVPVLMPPDTTLDVRVLDLLDGSEVAALTVTSAAGQQYLELSARTALPIRQWVVREGRATVTGLPPGEWIVSVTAVGGRSWNVPVFTQGGRMTLEIQ